MSGDEARGVLFDVDGTLVDTTYLHAVCWYDALRSVGVYVPMADIHHGIGMGSEELLEHLLGPDRDRSRDEEAVNAHLVLYRQFWGRLTPLPGAAELVRACAASGLTVVLASSASEEELGVLRSALDADDAVTAATSSSDADSAKPEPDLIQAALQRGGLSADNAIFVGDAVWDGVAAGKAGVPFVALTCGGTPAEDLWAAGAVEVWRDPAELNANLADTAVGRLRR